MPITTQNITMQNITDIVNVSNIPELYSNINDMIYGGWLWFILMWVGMIILFFAMQEQENQPLTNAMYSSTIITVVSLFLRATEAVRNGIVYALLTDYQMWVFPLITIVLASVLWLSKRD